MEIVKDPSKYPSNEGCLASQIRDSIEAKLRQTNLGYKFIVPEKYAKAAIKQIQDKEIRSAIRYMTEEIIRK